MSTKVRSRLPDGKHRELPKPIEEPEWKFDPDLAFDMAADFYSLLSPRLTERLDSNRAHGSQHGLNVMVNMVEIARHTPELAGMRVNYFNLYLAALLHDVEQVKSPNHRDNHQENGARYVAGLISRAISDESAVRKFGFTGEGVQTVFGLIKIHDLDEINRSSDGLSLEQKLFIDADNLEKIRAGNHLRTVAYGEEHGRILFNPRLSDLERLTEGRTDEETDGLSRMLYDMRVWGNPENYFLEHTKKMAQEQLEGYRREMLAYFGDLYDRPSKRTYNPRAFETIKGLLFLGEPGVTADTFRWDGSGNVKRGSRGRPVRT